MIKTNQPITSINGFHIGDKVRLKDGDGRAHTIKSFSIDGLKEFFFVVQFVDGTDAMLNNIALLPSDLDEAAETHFETMDMLEYENIFEETHKEIFKARAEWMAGQGVKASASVGYYNQCGLSILTEPSIKKLGFKEGDDLEITIKKK